MASVGQHNVATLLTPELLERARGLSMHARRIVEGGMHGLHRSPFFGFSIEFAEHREYSPGDEVKHIDWKVFARAERYVVKQYEQETNLRAILIVDRSSSMNYGRRDIVGREEDHGTKFEYARVLAATLAHILLGQGDSVGLLMTTREVTHQVPPHASPGHLLGLCAALVDAEPEAETDLSAALERIAAQLTRRSLVILISDLFDDPERMFSVMGQLHHRGHEVLIFQILDPTEYRFDLGQTSKGVTVIQDMETGAEFEAEPHLIQESVQAEIDRFLGKLDDGARRFGLHLVRCTTDQPVGEVIKQYLYRRHAGAAANRGGGR
jgi:uncharacterized protein (DUF58 family)